MEISHTVRHTCQARVSCGTCIPTSDGTYILYVHPCDIVIVWASRNDIHFHVLLTMMSATS